MPTPTAQHFADIARDFFHSWNFPNCIGSLDGKHIRLRRPANSGSMFYNYKQFFSITLMAVVDAKYSFVMIDVGAYGKDSDAGVFANSSINHAITNGIINLPNDKELPNGTIKASFVFVGDEAFPLRTYLMRPYPWRQAQNNDQARYFNYRLSRARMTVECAFGITAARFRILQKSIETGEGNAVHVVKAVCLLHNIIIKTENDLFINAPEASRTTSNMCNFNASRSNNRPARQAVEARQIFTQYFSANPLLRE